MDKRKGSPEMMIPKLPTINENLNWGDYSTASDDLSTPMDIDDQSHPNLGEFEIKEGVSYAK